MQSQRCTTSWWQVMAAGTALAGALAASLGQEMAGPTSPGVATEPAQSQPAQEHPPQNPADAFQFKPGAGGFDASTLSDEQIVQALRRGADYLLSVRNEDNWEDRAEPGVARGRRARPLVVAGTYGGHTALAVLALLHAGQSLHDDPVYGPKLHFRGKDMAPSVEWLTRLDTQATYVVALRASAMALLPQQAGGPATEGPRAALQRDLRYLSAAMMDGGGYTYGMPGGRRQGDLSNSQYAALGMWAIEDAGLAAPLGYWVTTDRFWRRLQRPSGSWPYAADPDAFSERDSMGLAGIATLYITREFTDRALRSISRRDPALENALAWLNERFTPNIGDLYSMYTIERIGLASGLRHFGTYDWYRELAANILAHQSTGGDWSENSWSSQVFIGANDVTSTAYALLFLARGRNPVVFSKLQYEGPWDARPMDVANLTRRMSAKFERPLNWQVVNLRTPATGAAAPSPGPSEAATGATRPAAPPRGTPTREWLDAPILVISGSRDPGFTAADIAKLRGFVEAGGMILSQSYESNAVFSQAMRNYAAQVAGNRYEMRRLPPDHLLFTSNLNVSLQGTPVLMGMSNGVREFWIHSPADIGASWQLKRTSNRVHFDLAAALYFYQTGKSPMRGRLKTLAAFTPAEPPERKAALARVIFSGNSDPEPGAWPALAEVLRRDRLNGVDLQVVRILPAELDAGKFALAHMTGTAPFLVKEEDCAAMRSYLRAGGTLIADAAGGHEGFTGSMREFVRQVLPEAKIEPLPPDHPLYTGRFGRAPEGAATAAGDSAAKREGEGWNLRQVEFRRYTREALQHASTDPQIEAVTLDGRICILLSKYDITAGLAGAQAWGISGYSPQDAQRLAENLVRYTLQPRRDAR